MEKKSRKRVDAGAGGKKQKKTKSGSTTEGMVIITGFHIYSGLIDSSPRWQPWLTRPS